MERTDTHVYKLSKMIIRSSGGQTIKDKNAKEILLTTLWCNFWDDEGDFQSQVEFAIDHFSMCSLLTNLWASLDLVHWKGRASKTMILGDFGELLLESALEEIRMFNENEAMRETVSAVKERVDTSLAKMDSFRDDMLLDLSDLKMSVSELKNCYVNVSDEVRKLRVSSIRGIK